MPAIAGWSDSIWGRRNRNVFRIRTVVDAPRVLPLAERPRLRVLQAPKQEEPSLSETAIAYDTLSDQH
jgi:hypothetical protein